MAWFKTKKVKKCICSKEPDVVIIYDDHMQARSWLFMLGSLVLLLWSILSIWAVYSGGLSGNEAWEELQRAWWFIVLVLYWSYICFILVGIARRGHSLKCAARQAFIKAI